MGGAARDEEMPARHPLLDAERSQGKNGRIDSAGCVAGGVEII
jgi:hypothetical protein